MTTVVNSLGVEQLVGPVDSVSELARNIDRTSFGFKEVVRVPFDETGLLTGESASIQSVEFGKGGIFLVSDVVVTTSEAAMTLDVGLAKATGSRAADAFTADPDGLVAAASLAATGIVEGTGALIGQVLDSRTQLTVAVNGGATDVKGYVLLEYMGGSDYFDNIDA